MVDYREFRLSRLRQDRFRHVPLLAFWPAYGLYFYAMEWLVPRENYFVMWCPLDDRIPFCEVFLIPYLFWFIFMVGAHVYTFFWDTGAFRRLMYFIFLTFGASCVIFAVFPTIQHLRPQVFPRDNFLTRVMAWFYTTDTNTNVCPSLHVCGSIAAAAALSDTERFSGRGWKTVNYTAAALISVSTVFVKQHSVIDTLCALVMSGGAYRIVYGRKKTARK